MLVFLKENQAIGREEVLKKLVDIHYLRNDVDFKRGVFRARGDVLEVFLAYEETAIRVEFEFDQVKKISRIDPLTGTVLYRLDSIAV